MGELIPIRKLVRDKRTHVRRSLGPWSVSLRAGAVAVIWENGEIWLSPAEAKSLAIDLLSVTGHGGVR